MITVTDEMVENIKAAIREHIKIDASGIAPAVAGYYLTGFDEAARAVAAALRAAPAAEPVGWQYEDELSRDYPYDAMFAHSQVRGGVRMFPVYAPPAPVADGWVMVPREPTPEMLDAFIDVALKPRDFSYGLEISDPRAGYRAMLAVAPTEADQ